MVTRGVIAAKPPHAPSDRKHKVFYDTSTWDRFSFFPKRTATTPDGKTTKTISEIPEQYRKVSLILSDREKRIQHNIWYSKGGNKFLANGDEVANRTGAIAAWKYEQLLKKATIVYIMTHDNPAFNRENCRSPLDSHDSTSPHYSDLSTSDSSMKGFRSIVLAKTMRQEDKKKREDKKKQKAGKGSMGGGGMDGGGLLHGVPQGSRFSSPYDI